MTDQKTKASTIDEEKPIPGSHTDIEPSAAESTKSDIVEIKSGIQTYLRSINQADTEMGADIFATSSETLFIHPRGTEIGWITISKNFYGLTMGETFSKRSLQITSGPRIAIYGDAAVADFNWDFHAIQSDNGQPKHTMGRESQTWIKLRDKGWRIVAVHYSGPPVTAKGEGF
ncbi:YybH family protein [Gluconobacter cadivus]|uniref:DUF3225 domain-containing protein n=1 Tax=Gluconobacter cadivus TaxID=2728101 RepID=A0ABR9YYW6_9PROT|nr:AtzH-like domain-containing protein [Gluconobacter cadivus]MBF0889756.1 DUF3225 domain-containing protein [Gluconobacter cadivus]